MEGVTPRLSGSAPWGVCSRQLDGVNCGRPAVAHIIWDYTPNHSLACAEHLRTTLEDFVPLNWHEFDHDACLTPGSLYDFTKNRCRRNIHWIESALPHFANFRQETRHG